ncbi:MAG: CinA family protein [Oscillospiraceae bacterium]|jgi:PncC family amidohydrolase|nr:CinA family protein [Oscillospiraceae bacterium]
MGIDASALVSLLREKNLKIAVAESCTGGWFAKAITDTSGASAVFDCGVVAYANAVKAKLLAVPEEDLAQFGAVSERVAKAMAEGVRALAGADIGVGITGIAGPRSDQTDKPVGLIYIAVAGTKGCVVKEHRTAFHGDVRGQNRMFAVQEALRMAEAYALLI